MKVRQRKSKEYQKVQLSEYQEGALIGSILGDLYLGINRLGYEAIGNYAHCEKQKEYIYHKFELFKPLSGTIRRKKDTPDSRTKKIYPSYMATLKGNPYLTKLHSMFYKERKKIIPDCIKEMLTEVSLAYWFMDDGYKTVRSGYYLATNSFLKEDGEKLVTALSEKFNLKCNLDKEGRIYINRCSVKTFNILIKSYILPCMQYKLINL